MLNTKFVVSAHARPFVLDSVLQKYSYGSKGEVVLLFCGKGLFMNYISLRLSVIGFINISSQVSIKSYDQYTEFAKKSDNFVNSSTLPVGPNFKQYFIDFRKLFINID